MELKEAFETALDFENKGHKIYEEIANKTENPVIAKTFRYLADQELYHIEEIKEYISKLGDGKEVELKGDKLEDTKRFFTMTVKEFKEKTELSDDDLKAHETGLELETRSYDFYKQQLDSTDDEDAKKFFRFLMEQENAHYKLISKAYDFIKDPVSFYTKEEGWLLEGG